MSVDLSAGVVAVLNRQGAIAGTGFVVMGRSPLVITCSHVLVEAGYAIGDSVAVRFYVGGTEGKATAVPNWWRGPDDVDIAVLQLAVPLPRGTSPLPLYLSSHTKRGEEILALGYPDVGRVDGVWGTGQYVKEITEEGRRLLQITSKQITLGFSGGPVLDTGQDRVIGVVAKIATPDLYARLSDTAFAVPCATLRSICPELLLAEPTSVAFRADPRERLRYYASGPLSTAHAARTPRVPVPHRPLAGLLIGAALCVLCWVFFNSVFSFIDQFQQKWNDVERRGDEFDKRFQREWNERDPSLPGDPDDFTRRFNEKHKQFDKEMNEAKQQFDKEYDDFMKGYILFWNVSYYVCWSTAILIVFLALVSLTQFLLARVESFPALVLDRHAMLITGLACTSMVIVEAQDGRRKQLLGNKSIIRLLNTGDVITAFMKKGYIVDFIVASSAPPQSRSPRDYR